MISAFTFTFRLLESSSIIELEFAGVAENYISSRQPPSHCNKDLGLFQSKYHTNWKCYHKFLHQVFQVMTLSSLFLSFCDNSFPALDQTV